MRLLCLISLFTLFALNTGDDLDKYYPILDKCQRTPSNSECIELKSKFLQLIKKCQKLKSQEQIILCQQVKAKLCAVFPSTCGQSVPTTKLTTRRKPTKAKVIPTKVTTTTTAKATTVSMQSNEEFVKVPVNPDELRIRGEYCIRHGKEIKCQQLLNNLKNVYSTCNKKKSQSAPTKPEEIDCNSFQTHLCKAFPKFPPCLKKTPK
jgi:hypothetical protein